MGREEFYRQEKVPIQIKVTRKVAIPVMILWMLLLFHGPLWSQAPEILIQNAHSSGVRAVVFSPDGKILASGSDDHTVKLWEAGSGKLLHTLQGHSSDVMAVTFAPNGLSLASGSTDTSIKIWNVQKGRTILNLLAMDQNEWAAWTPDGYFAASARGARNVTWRVGDQLASFDQYEDVLYKPDLIARAMQGEELPTPKVIISRDLPPKLSFQNAVTTTKQPKVKIVLKYQGSHFKKLDVFLNGAPIKKWKRVGHDYYQIPLNLEQHQNTLRVRAYDEKSLKSSWLEQEITFIGGIKGAPGF